MTSHSPNTLPTALQTVSSRVEAAMKRDLDQRLTASDPLLRELLDYALFGGGKRVRPFLCVQAARCCGRDDEGLSLLAAALEYLHTATLMHDDVLDHAPLRRGRETAATRYSVEEAVLAGDWLHARSLYLVGRLTGAAGLDVFCSATEGMVNGEFLQKRLAGDITSGEADYYAVIRRKTGNLMSSSCALGALYADAEAAKVAALTRFGEHLGLAFQIVDDLLDYTGSPETGKLSGNDFQEGKVTLPLIRALAKADEAERREIAALMSGDRKSAEARAAMTAHIDKHGGFASAAETAKEHIAAARRELEIFADSPEAEASVALLRELAAYIVVRKK